MAGQRGPDIVPALPSIFLQDRAKLRLPEPEHTEIGLVLEGVLGQPHTIEVFGIEPVHIRMGILWVTRPPIHFMTINRPEIGHDIEIVLGNITSSVGIEDPGHKV
jgi:hypothetical protein